jgi:hypothetical protein
MRDDGLILVGNGEGEAEYILRGEGVVCRSRRGRGTEAALE